MYPCLYIPNPFLLERQLCYSTSFNYEIHKAQCRHIFLKWFVSLRSITSFRLGFDSTLNLIRARTSWFEENLLKLWSGRAIGHSKLHLPCQVLRKTTIDPSQSHPQLFQRTTSFIETIHRYFFQKPPNKDSTSAPYNNSNPRCVVGGVAGETLPSSDPRMNITRREAARRVTPVTSVFKRSATTRRPVAMSPGCRDCFSLYPVELPCFSLGAESFGSGIKRVSLRYAKFLFFLVAINIECNLNVCISRIYAIVYIHISEKVSEKLLVRMRINTNSKMIDKHKYLF